MLISLGVWKVRIFPIGELKNELILSVDGRVISEIQPDLVQKTALEIQAKGIEDIAVVGVYAPTDLVYRQEEAVEAILRSALGENVNITLSHQVAGIGFLERENATILNAAILPLAQRTIRQFQNAARNLDIAAPLYVATYVPLVINNMS